MLVNLFALLTCPDIWNELIITVKRIIYIDNFLAHYGYSPTTGYALVPLLQSEGFEVIPASNKKSQFLRLLHMLFTIAKHR